MIFLLSYSIAPFDVILSAHSQATPEADALLTPTDYSLQSLPNGLQIAKDGDMSPVRTDAAPSDQAVALWHHGFLGEDDTVAAPED